MQLDDVWHFLKIQVKNYERNVKTLFVLFSGLCVADTNSKWPKRKREGFLIRM